MKRDLRVTKKIFINYGIIHLQKISNKYQTNYCQSKHAKLYSNTGTSPTSSKQSPITAINDPNTTNASCQTLFLNKL